MGLVNWASLNGASWPAWTSWAKGPCRFHVSNMHISKSKLHPILTKYTIFQLDNILVSMVYPLCFFYARHLIYIRTPLREFMKHVFKTQQAKLCIYTISHLIKVKSTDHIQHDRGLYFLERRGLKGDLIEVYEFMRGIFRVNV